MGGFEPPTSLPTSDIFLRRMSSGIMSCLLNVLSPTELHGNIKARTMTRTGTYSIIIQCICFDFSLTAIYPTLQHLAYMPTGLLWNGLGSSPRPTPHGAFASTRSDYILTQSWGPSSVASRPAMYLLRADAPCRFWVPSSAGCIFIDLVGKRGLEPLT